MKDRERENKVIENKKGELGYKKYTSGSVSPILIPISRVQVNGLNLQSKLDCVSKNRGDRRIDPCRQIYQIARHAL